MRIRCCCTAVMTLWVALSCLSYSAAAAALFTTASGSVERSNAPPPVDDNQWRMPMYYGLIAKDRSKELEPGTRRMARNTVPVPQMETLRMFGGIMSPTELFEREYGPMRLLDSPIEDEESSSLNRQRNLPMGFRMSSNPWLIRRLQRRIRLQRMNQD